MYTTFLSFIFNWRQTRRQYAQHCWWDKIMKTHWSVVMTFW